MADAPSVSPRRGPFQVISGLLLLAAARLQAWTQVQAYHYGYHPLLGVPLGSVHVFYHDHRVYWPWQALAWQWRWGGLWGRVGLVGSALLLLAVVVGTVWLV